MVGEEVDTHSYLTDVVGIFSRILSLNLLQLQLLPTFVRKLVCNGRGEALPSLAAALLHSVYPGRGAVLGELKRCREPFPNASHLYSDFTLVRRRTLGIGEELAIVLVVELIRGKGQEIGDCLTADIHHILQLKGLSVDQCRQEHFFRVVVSQHVVARHEESRAVAQSQTEHPVAMLHVGAFRAFPRGGQTPHKR